MEWVRDYQGASYYNDSKATNVGAVVRALESFNKPVLHIAGGKDKGGDYSPLRELVKNRVKTLILIGEASERIAESLGDCTKTIVVKSLEDAVFEARKIAESGEIVILSPACASYDMFRDYEERGDHFKSLVKALSSPEV
jgi:UDP-N-acetylmuramoylalanine--D-glutamate ligase